MIGLLILFPQAGAGAHKLRPFTSTVNGVAWVLVYQGVHLIIIR